MTTHVLTPKAADPVTGLSTKLLAWNFSGATFQDVYQGFIIIAWSGWRPFLFIDDNKPVEFPTPPFFKLELKKPGFNVVEVEDTEYFASDGKVLHKLTYDEANTNYDITQWKGPVSLGGTGGV